jgi:hypothetical protein
MALQRQLELLQDSLVQLAMMQLPIFLTAPRFIFLITLPLRQSLLALTAFQRTMQQLHIRTLLQGFGIALLPSPRLQFLPQEITLELAPPQPSTASTAQLRLVALRLLVETLLTPTVTGCTPLPGPEPSPHSSH